MPASLCGVFSLKPTYGRLTRTGAFPFVDSLDHLGPMARSPGDLALAYDALQGSDPRDHGCANRPIEPTAAKLPLGAGALRIGLLGGWFSANAGPEARRALARTVEALRKPAEIVPVQLCAAEAGRAAAFLITNSEGAAFHLTRLRRRIDEFDPDTRDRFLAGAAARGLGCAGTTRAALVA